MRSRGRDRDDQDDEDGKKKWAAAPMMPSMMSASVITLGPTDNSLDVGYQATTKLWHKKVELERGILLFPVADSSRHLQGARKGAVLVARSWVLMGA